MAASLSSLRISGLVVGLFVNFSILTAFPANYAGDVFSLEIWTLTIPLDDDGDGFADEVAMPTLRNFEDPDFFHLSETSDSIVFRARGGDAKAEGYSYPRCELRELKKGSEAPANWSASDGLVHNLTITLGIKTDMSGETRVVAAGIYAEKEEVVTVSLEGERLLMARAGLDPLVLESVYVPGTLFDLMLIVDKGRIRAFYKATQIAEWSLEKTALHFRAGCEVQSKSTPADRQNHFGEVEIQKLYVTHKSR